MKNNFTLKLFLCIMMLALCISVFAIPAFAKSDSATGKSGIEEDAGYSAGAGDTALDGAENRADNEVSGEASDSAADDTKEDATDGTESIFGLVYEGVMSHAGEILSLLSFIASAILLFCYRRGILPTITAHASLSRSEIKAVREAANEQTVKLEAFAEHIENAFASFASDIEGLRTELSSLGEGLGSALSQGGELKSAKTALLSEIEMLYEVFMASSLPQYQKDRIGERVSNMKKTLGVECYEGE